MPVNLLASTRTVDNPHPRGRVWAHAARGTLSLLMRPAPPVLLGLRRHIGRTDGRLALVAVLLHIRRLLRVAGLERALPFYDSVEDALDSM